MILLLELEARAMNQDVFGQGFASNSESTAIPSGASSPSDLGPMATLMYLLYSFARAIEVTPANPPCKLYSNVLIHIFVVPINYSG